jgi:predicted phosphodiesterase
MSDEDLLKIIKEQHLTETEIKTLLKQLKHPKQEHYKRTIPFSKHYKIGVISDWHVGNKNFREDVFCDSVKVFNKEKVDFIVHPGDIIDGMSNRDGHIYELAILGLTKQVDKAVDLLSQYQQPIYAILGNHDLWGMNKANQGVHIGADLENRIKDFTIVGDLRGDLVIGSVTVRLSHEGNSAYALSYSMQKIINGLPGGDKPGVIINGHLHKGMYMFYRNVHAMEAMTFEDQTPFMAMKGSPAHVGFSIVDLYVDKFGVQKFSPTFYPYYD